MKNFFGTVARGAAVMIEAAACGVVNAPEIMDDIRKLKHVRTTLTDAQVTGIAADRCRWTPRGQAAQPEAEARTTGARPALA
jgi:hypothetical protein